MRKNRISLSFLFILAILLAGCGEPDSQQSGSENPGTSSVVSATSEQLSSDPASSSASEQSSDISGEEVAVYGNGVRLLARTVYTYSQGVSDQYEEYAIEINGELRYPFDSGVEEIREEYGYLRVLFQDGEALLDPDGEELIPFGTYDDLYLSRNWLSAIRKDKSCTLFRLADGALEEVLQADTTYHFQHEYNGIGQFSGKDGNLLIAEDGTPTYTDLTDLEELEQNGDMLNDTVQAFYQALLQCSSENYDKILPYLPSGAQQILAETDLPEETDPTELSGYQLLYWLLQNSDKLSATCYPTDWEIACTAPGGSSLGILLFTCGEYEFEPVFALTAASDGTFYISSLSGALR